MIDSRWQDRAGYAESLLEAKQAAFFCYQMENAAYNVLIVGKLARNGFGYFNHHETKYAVFESEMAFGFDDFTPLEYCTAHSWHRFDQLEWKPWRKDMGTVLHGLTHNE